MYRLDQLLEQVDQGSQVVAVEPIQIAEDIAIPRRDSDLTAWVRSPRLVYTEHVLHSRSVCACIIFPLHAKSASIPTAFQSHRQGHALALP